MDPSSLTKQHKLLLYLWPQIASIHHLGQKKAKQTIPVHSLHLGKSTAGTEPYWGSLYQRGKQLFFIIYVVFL